MDMGLAGKVALVTGGGQGIGRQISRTLSEEGARVAVNDVVLEKAESTAAEIRGRGGEAMAVQADVTDENAVNAMVQRVIDGWGAINVLVNNAGIPLRIGDPAGGGGQGERYFPAGGRKSWDRTMNLITYGVLNCCQAVLPCMVENSGGKIVSIISDAGRVGEPRLTTYSMAKAGVIGYSKALAKEVGRHNINVNCVSPGATATPATGNIGQSERTPEQEERMRAIYRVYPMARGLNRLGLPSDIADAVTFLVSQRANWITGQTLSVSGGYSMM
ncbi:MAG: SDR family NAD(P)-dependent oxidoreductase [Dehalococcoidia bacterium]